MANPYDLSSLNGVVFTRDEVGFGGDLGISSYSGDNVSISSDNIHTNYYNNYIVTNYMNNYVHGNTVNGHYYLPTFGTVTLAKYDGLGGGLSGLGQTNGTVLYVHGFETNGSGVLLSSYQSLYFDNSNGQISYYGSHLGVLSNTPIASPGYPTTSLTFGSNGSNFQAQPNPAGPAADPHQGLAASGGSGGSGLSSLNGVHFYTGNIAIGTSAYTGGAIQLDASGTSGSTVSVQAIGTIGGGSSGATVTSVTPQYTHGMQGANACYLPTLGSITLSSSVGGQTTLYVHGVENNSQGLLVSNEKYVGFQTKTDPNSGQLYLATVGQSSAVTAYIGILSNVDIGDGRNSPSYNQGTPGYAPPGGVAAGDGNPHPLNDINGTSAFPLTFNSTSVYTPPCFAEGTRVLTAQDERAVEDLAVGDEVVTASGATRPVIWIGSRRVRPANHPHPAEVNPVRVRAGAFGEGAPARDLRLSPGHAVFVDGALVPVGLLVNGATIVQEAVERVRYFHIELDAHDVLLAEGLPCESYLDDGNRETFAEADLHLALYGRLDPVDWDGACAPVLADREALAPIQAQLHARAEALGWTRSTEGDFRLLAGSEALAPVHAVGGKLWFAIPPGVAALTLSSAASRPVDLIPGALDARTLGVAVSGLRVDGVDLGLDHVAFGAGFDAVERDGVAAWRWSDGAAELAVAGPAMVELTLHMVAPAWTRPERKVGAAPLRLVQVG